MESHGKAFHLFKRVTQAIAFMEELIRVPKA